MDGLLESTTAKLDGAPYSKNLSLPGLTQENKGMNIINQARLQKYIWELQHLFDFHIHAIGDGGS